MRVLGQPANYKLLDYSQTRDNFQESSFHFTFDYAIPDEETISHYKRGLEENGWRVVAKEYAGMVYQKDGKRALGDIKYQISVKKLESGNWQVDMYYVK
jgi:hypothetical protein